MTTTESSVLLPATCKVCGSCYLFESALCCGVELGNVLGTCDACLEAADTRQHAERENSRKAAIAREIAATIPPDLRATDPDHPDFDRPLWTVVRRWRPSPDSFWLLLVGPAARCKTRCMALLAERAMWAGQRVAWTTAHRIKAAAIERHHQDRETQNAAREHRQAALKSQWLFVDDIGKADFSPSFESDFFELLDHRKTHRLTTVFSSNVHPEEFALCLSRVNAEPIIGRLLDRVTLIDLRTP